MEEKSILALRAQHISPFMVMEIMERAQELEAQGRHIIHMEVGEPDFPTPEVIVRAMRKALDANFFHYTHSLGDLELREALSSHYRSFYGVDISPERFLICPGTSIGLNLLISSILDAGDKVVLSNPHYSCYPNFVRFAGATPFKVNVSEKDGFRFDPDILGRVIRSDPTIRAVIINSPANPTGAVWEPLRLAEIAKLGVFVISDEIYHGLNYQEERDHTILEYTNKACVVGGFSKTFAMTGWRIGYLILPTELIRPLQIIAQNFLISVNSAVQKAGVAALKYAWEDVTRMRFLYNERRLLLLNGLRSLGFEILSEPMGAFYILAKADFINPDSRALAFQILEEAGVGTTPGADFGSGAEGYLRFSYATASENIHTGLVRVKDFLLKHSKLSV
ncbi:MAG: pyridoxal phosphate-dependent aminotransferase [Deltaproteobacteria bacterium]|jgi:aspartate/methionine/tyrosine aminotransferase|nr:pyridoxal phosphate-dependent aminotransferase [Deltaproteobacteria bacterium]